MESLRMQFTAIKEKLDLSPHDKFWEMRAAFKLAHPQITDERQIQNAIFTSEPDLLREYLNAPGTK